MAFVADSLRDWSSLDEFALGQAPRGHAARIRPCSPWPVHWSGVRERHPVDSFDAAKLPNKQNLGQYFCSGVSVCRAEACFDASMQRPA